MKTGVVITCGAGREDNVTRALEYLDELCIERPEAVVVVLDGHDVKLPWEPDEHDLELHAERIPKHQPGQEQPRNVGVRVLERVKPELTHVWFLDSDIIVLPNCLQYYQEAVAEVGEHAILVGPYEWLPPGVDIPLDELRNDPRWEMFNDRGIGPFVADLGVALGNFGGNLVWPIEDFVRIGGFHPLLHHGRCEDGELGLRAASARIPMALVAGARGWHVAHPINHELALQRNARDVPLLNAWHPWVSQKGLIVTDQDGARFDFQCSCGQQVNTLEMWQHFALHPANEPVPDLILPEGM